CRRRGNGTRTRRRTAGRRARRAKSLSVFVDSPDCQRRENRPSAGTAGARCAEPVARSGTPRHGDDRPVGTHADPYHGRLCAADCAGSDDADPGYESARALKEGAHPSPPTLRRAHLSPGDCHLQGLFTVLTSTDTNSLFDRRDENLAVTDLAGTG